MFKKTYSTVFLCFLFSHQAMAALPKCEAALAPTEISGQSSYSKTVAYMYLNAESEYDKLHNMSASDRSASASYGAFSAEYADSSSASEFKEKIRNRLTKENFSLSEDEAKSSYRRFLSPEQLKSWENCVANVSGVSQVLLSFRPGADNAIPLKMQWHAGVNQGTGTLKLVLANGTIDGKNYVDQYLQGSGEYSWIVKPDTNFDRVIVVANIEGATDDITMLKKYPEVVATVTPAAAPKPIAKAIVQPYTTQDDGRISKSLTCPNDTEILPGSGSCHRTANDFGILKNSVQAGPYTWACQWNTPQPIGVGIHVEAVCRTATQPQLYKQIEHVRQTYTTGGAGDDRTTKQLTCGTGKVVIPGSGQCLRTAVDHGNVVNSRQNGDNGWFCQYDTQPQGVGIWVEMDCGVAVK